MGIESQQWSGEDQNAAEGKRLTQEDLADPERAPKVHYAQELQKTIYLRRKEQPDMFQAFVSLGRELPQTARLTRYFASGSVWGSLVDFDTEDEYVWKRIQAFAQEYGLKKEHLN